MGKFQNNLLRRRRTVSQLTQKGSIYKCFCQKKYMSYPALYLHAEIKHNLRIKNRHLFLKNKPQELGKQYVQLNKNQFQKTHDGYQELQGEVYHQKKTHLIPSKIRTLRTTRRNKENKFIQEGQKLEDYSTKQDLVTVLALFQQCLNSNYRMFDQRNIQIVDEYALEADGKMIAQFFNYFSVFYVPQFISLNSNILNQDSLIRKPQLNGFLQYFGNWLFQKGYSKLEVYHERQKQKISLKYENIE